MVDRIARLTQLQREKLADLHGVANARQIGTITAFEIEAPEGDYLSPLGPLLLSFFRERNLLLRPLGNTVYVMPPYCIGEEDLTAIYTAIGEAAEVVRYRSA